jgi:hypothetical protein
MNNKKAANKRWDIAVELQEFMKTRTNSPEDAVSVLTLLLAHLTATVARDESDLLDGIKYVHDRIRLIACDLFVRKHKA